MARGTGSAGRMKKRNLQSPLLHREWHWKGIRFAFAVPAARQERSLVVNE
jgi:hypothetical protein